MTMVILGLGSNQGDRAQHLKEAVAALGAWLANLRCSPVYETPALLPEGAPPEWGVPFLNMAVSGEAQCTPRELLGALKAIEGKLGRIARGHWGPREIDIDILAWDDLVVAEPDLAVPHAELLKRDFALVPLAALTPDWVHPLAGKAARQLAAAMNSNLTRMDIRIS